MGYYTFNQRRISEVYRENKNGDILQVIASQALAEKHIKSDKSALVSLGKKYDCGCRIQIKPTRSGK